MFETILEKVEGGCEIYDACALLGITEFHYRKIPKAQREKLVEVRKKFNSEKNKTHTQGDPENFIRKAF